MAAPVAAMIATTFAMLMPTPDTLSGPMPPPSRWRAAAPAFCGVASTPATCSLLLAAPADATEPTAPAACDAPTCRPTPGAAAEPLAVALGAAVGGHAVT